MLLFLADVCANVSFLLLGRFSKPDHSLKFPYLRPTLYRMVTPREQQGNACPALHYEYCPRVHSLDSKYRRASKLQNLSGAKSLLLCINSCTRKNNGGQHVGKLRAVTNYRDGSSMGRAVPYCGNLRAVYRKHFLLL